MPVFVPLLLAVIRSGAAKTIDKPTSLVLVHHESEGSHALVQDLNTLFPCTRFYIHEGIASRALTLRKFFEAPSYSEIPSSFNMSVSYRPGQPPTADAADAVMNNTTRLQHEIWQFLSLVKEKEAAELDAGVECACESRGLLVRVHRETMVPDWCDYAKDLFGSDADLPSHVRVVVVVRFDLLRWAISMYEREDPNYWDAANPQFDVHENVSFVDLRGGRVTYDLNYLERAIEFGVAKWTANAKFIKELQECGIEPVLSAYEIFDDVGVPDDFARSMLAGCDGNSSAAWPTFRERYAMHDQVRKVHTYKISDFAHNAHEIYQWFYARNYPTFAAVAKSVCLNLDEMEWL